MTSRDRRLTVRTALVFVLFFLAIVLLRLRSGNRGIRRLSDWQAAAAQEQAMLFVMEGTVFYGDSASLDTDMPLDVADLADEDYVPVLSPPERRCLNRLRQRVPCVQLPGSELYEVLQNSDIAARKAETRTEV